MLTRNDFVILAEEISEIAFYVGKVCAVVAVIKACKRINSGFKTGKFIEACKLNKKDTQSLIARYN